MIVIKYNLDIKYFRCLISSFLDRRVNMLPAMNSPQIVPNDKYTVKLPARVSDKVPIDVSWKYVPRIRSDVLTNDEPTWAKTTIQKMPLVSTCRNDGSRLSNMIEYMIIPMICKKRNGLARKEVPSIFLLSNCRSKFGDSLFCGSFTLWGESFTNK